MTDITVKVKANTPFKKIFDAAEVRNSKQRIMCWLVLALITRLAEAVWKGSRFVFPV
jgi:hypothetical protein